VMWSNLNFDTHNHITRTAEASHQILYTGRIGQVLASWWQTTL